MKLITYVTIFIVIFCAALFFYVEWDQKRFQENLPKVPEKVAPQMSSPAELPQTQRVEKPIDSETTSGGRDNTREADDFDINSHSADSTELTDGSGGVTELPPDFSSLETFTQMDSEQLSLSEMDIYHEKPWLKPISEMSEEELVAEVERRKQRLIADFGNTPEVAIINKYTTVDALRGKTVSFEGIDGFEYIRAISVLWPTGANRMLYQELEHDQQKGWHKNPLQGRVITR